MKIRLVLLLFAAAKLSILAPCGSAQTAIASSAFPFAMAETPTVKSPEANPVYVRPTERMKLRAYWFDAFGPYPFAGAALIAGVHQGENTPPEWGQSAEAFSERFASSLAIAGVTTTMRVVWPKPFVKTRCITAASAKESCGGWSI